MRYIRKYGNDRAVIAKLTVWRRLLLAAALVALAKLGGDQVIGAICLVAAGGIAISAIHVAFLKLRMIAWP